MMVVALAAVWWALIQPAPLNPPRDDFAQAAVRALESYDLSIDSIEYAWTSYSHIEGKIVPNVMGEAGSTHSLGHSYVWGRWPDLTGRRSVAYERRVVINGTRGYGWRPIDKPELVGCNGIGDPQSDDPRIEHLLGRNMDWTGMRTLAELLASDPAVLAARQADGTIVLRAHPQDWSPRGETLIVTLDPGKGFAPVRMESRLGVDGQTPMYECRVTKFERVLDVWVPVEGVFAVYTPTSAARAGIAFPAEARGKFDVAASTVSAWEELAQPHANGLPTKGWVQSGRGGPGMIKVESVLSLNAGLRSDRTTFELPSPAFIVDLGGTQRCWRADGAQDLMNAKALFQLPVMSDEEVARLRSEAKGHRRPRRRRRGRTGVARASRLGRGLPALATLGVLMLLQRAEARRLPPADESQSLRIVSAESVERGAHPVSSTVTRTITIENKLDVPIALSVASKSCGCTQVLLTASRLDSAERADVTLVTTVQPIGGVQRQHAEILVVPDGAPAEKFLAEMEYLAGGDCTASTEPIRLWTVVGIPVEASWWVTSASPGVPPGVGSASLTPSVPGSVAVQPVAAETPYARDLRLHVEGRSPGTYRGLVSAVVSSQQAPNISAPVLARIAPAAWVEGGGIVITDAEPHGQQRDVVVHERRAERPAAPWTVRVEPPDSGFQAEWAMRGGASGSDRTLRVVYNGSATNAAAYAVIEGGGLVLARVPLSVISLK